MSYQHPQKWLRCVSEPFADMITGIRALDAANNYRVNAVAYAVLESAVFGATDNHSKEYFRGAYLLTLVVQVPPENSYFALGLPLWQDIYGELDAGRGPDHDCCQYFRSPASQGGAWPARWPLRPPCSILNVIP